ncbi:GNAT family N-acetyltransferase [Kitasatospora sp. NPDC092948]|uniref:GNAT family N-acetyltransferase n=1 Tax=Kitasatospora sp. NPDC092948 TaxID=3364088 RepID=UPI0037FF30DD
MAPSDRPAAVDLAVRTNTDPDFYQVMGPHLASKTVHKALGGPPWDEDGKVWVTAGADGEPALGFVGVVLLKNGTGRVESLYTVPGERDTGLAQRLVAAAVQAAGPRHLRAVVPPQFVDAYTAAGFATTAVPDKYTRMHRDPDPTEQPT